MTNAPVALMTLNEATRALAGMHDLAEVKQLRDIAEAYRVYARAHHLGLDAQDHAGIIATRASLRQGEILDDMGKSGERYTPATVGVLGGRPSAEPKPNSQSEFGLKKSLADLGTSAREAMLAIALAREPEAVEKYLATAKRITPAKAARVAQAARRRRAAAAAPPLPTGVFDVLLIDPPWQYNNSGGLPGQAENHYGTMSLDELGALELPAADDAVLFLWVTSPMLQDALTLLDRWAFAYKTNVVWVKTNLRRPGVGFYVRGRHELLFIATRGSMVPDQEGRAPVGSVIEADAPDHSRKPVEAYELIEFLYPGGSYVEFFARANRRGWTSWGDDSALSMADAEVDQ